MSEYSPKSILVTGGAGFIGANFVHYLLRANRDVRVVVLDLLTYAGREENLHEAFSTGRLSFVKGDIRDTEAVELAMRDVDTVLHFAAESHVDRSILAAQDFISTNVYGTYVLLQEALKHQVRRFVNIGTDEVYGTILEGRASEDFPLKPSSPYSASKGGQDLIAHAHFATFGTPIITTRSSNNFGPYQYPEKLVPLFISNALQEQPLPLYGDGLQIRDWIFVEDNCDAIYTVLRKGRIGETYNIGADNELTNHEIALKIVHALGKPESLIIPVKDRPGHDRRYAIDSSKIRALGWKPRRSLEEALALTISWYQTHDLWWKQIKERQESFKEFYAANYSLRGSSPQ